MNLLQKNKLSSLVAGLLFACHPVLTEAVNGISFNEDLLATFFYLLSFIFYLKLDPGHKKLKTGHYLLALVFYLLGLLSKEMAITLPVIILLYDIFIRQAPGADGNPQAANIFVSGLLSAKYLLFKPEFYNHNQSSWGSPIYVWQYRWAATIFTRSHLQFHPVSHPPDQFIRRLWVFLSKKFLWIV